MPENQMLKAAMEYLQRGWSVIPLKRDKKPLLVSWKMYQGRLPTVEELRGWWKNWPDANVGVVTGKVSGLVVVDTDGPEGSESLRGLGNMPITPAVQTGKGWHYYYSHPGKEIRNFARRLPGLDLRGDGGYVVAPPSIHPSGHVYEWALGLEPGSVQLVGIPLGIMGLLEVGTGVAGTSKTKPGKPVAEKAADWVAVALAGVKDGERNATAAKLAGYFLGQGQAPSVVEQILLAWDSRNKPSLGPQVIGTTVASVARAEAEKKQGKRNFEIAKIEKILTEPPIYKVHIFDKIVVMASEDLTSFSRFKHVVFRSTNRVLKVKKITEWDDCLEEAMTTNLKEIEAPEEASPDAVLWDAVSYYLVNRAQADITVLTQKGVYKDDIYYYMIGTGLLQYLNQRQFRVEPNKLWRVVNERGAVSKAKWSKDATGANKKVRCWWVPIEAVTLGCDEIKPGEETPEDDNNYHVEGEEYEVDPY